MEVTAIENDFINWLRARKTSDSEIKGHIRNMDFVSSWLSDRDKCLTDIWCVKEVSKIDSIMSSLLNSKTQGTYSLLEIRATLLTYKKYLSEKQNENDDSHKEWRSLSTADTKYDYEKRLNDVTVFLLKKYKDNPASTLRQISKETPEISMSCINVWTKNLYNKTALEYLASKEIVIAKNLEKARPSSTESTEDSKTILDEYISTLKKKYKGKPAKTYVQVRKENRCMPFSKIQTWIKDIYGKTTAQFLIEEGIIADESNPLSDEDLLSELMISLEKKYRDNPASTFRQIKKENRHLPISKMEKWTRSTTGLTAKDYLVKEGLILDLKTSIDLTNEKLLFNYDEKQYMCSSLTQDFYFIEDVQRIYSERFGEDNLNKINAANMKTCSYHYYTAYIIKDTFSHAEEYFERLIKQNDLIDLHSFDKRLFYDRFFRQSITNLCCRYDYLEYDNWKYISLNRCSSIAQDITKDAILVFVEDILGYLSESDYITIRYIQNSGYDSPLFHLGFSDLFCSSLLKHSQRFGVFKINETHVFYRLDIGSRKEKKDFIKSLVFPVSSIDLDDLVDILNIDYGLDYSRDRIIECVRETDMYYDKIMDKVYYKKDFYYDEL